MIGQLANEWWGYILLGLAAGIVSGTLGLGSGTVIIPTLVLVCGIEQKSAQGVALAVMVPMAFVGAVRYWQNPDIYMNGRIVVLIVVGALVGAVVGAELAGRLPTSVVRRIFALFLVIVAIKMFNAPPATKGKDSVERLTSQTNSNTVERRGTNNEP
ncbi:MAG: sulfite exporter TauE/SafE family protein [Phycisphaerales bacterium]|nr:MAG: sulfite exporter TauE/SafE family protein [Phycisphaerales bacterium]